MAGLLSYLFGQPRGLLAQNSGMNQLPPEPYDPRQGKMEGLSQGLLGLGAGIAGGQNWGQGLSMGLLGANQGMQQGQDNYRRDTLFNQEIADNERSNAERARAEAFFGGGQGPAQAPSLATQPGTVTTPGSTQYAQAGGAAPQSSVPQQLAGMIDDNQWSQVQFMFQVAGRDAAQATLEGMLKPKDPLKLGEGEQLYDPDTFQPIASGPEKPPFPGAIRDGDNWIVDPDFQGAMIDRAAAGRSSSNTTVNMGPTGIDYGDPGPGLVWQRDQNQNIVTDDRGAPIAIPYQGGEAYIAQEAAAAADETKLGQQTITANIVTQDIDRALKIIEGSPYFTTGLAGDWASKVPGTAARDLKGLLDTVKANAGFDALQRMRDSSKTGGALGQVTIPELQMLQAAIGNLEQSQSQGQLVTNMKRVRQIYSAIIDGPGGGQDDPLGIR